jgi:hypothetical protein
MNTAYKPSIMLNTETLTKSQPEHALAISLFPFAGIVGALVMLTLTGIRTSGMIVFGVFSVYQNCKSSTQWIRH